LLSDWQSAFKRLSFILIGLLIAGWLIGEVAIGLLSGLLVYLTYQLIQLRRLYSWLHHQNPAEPTPPPESRGIWAYVFDGIYLLQRRERDALNELRSIIDKAQESTAALEIGVVMINANNALVWWNPAASRLLGLQNPKDRKQAVTNLIRDPKFVEYFNKANFGIPLKLGSHVNLSVMLEYQITGFGEGERLMLVRDISQLHRLETMRKDFIGNVSHELRTPITVISGYLETMLDDRDNLPGRWIRPLEQMAQQSQRMENIIRDLLTLSRLETRPSSEQQTAVHIRSLMLDIKHDAERVFADKKQKFKLEFSGAHKDIKKDYRPRLTELQEMTMIKQYGLDLGSRYDQGDLDPRSLDLDHKRALTIKIGDRPCCYRNINIKEGLLSVWES
jgi:two-component system phosphate regulon sensor histidine kinase PhoR